MKTFSLTPRVSKSLADTITPVGAYRRLRRFFPRSVLLESSDYNRADNSFSYICCDPIAEVKIEGATITFALPDGSCIVEQRSERKEPRHQLAYAVLKEFSSYFNVANAQSLPKGVINGLFGYMSYDAITLMEDIDLKAKSDPACAVPELQYAIYRYVLAFDHYRNELSIVENGCDPGPATPSKNVLVLASSAEVEIERFRVDGDVQSNLTDHQHRALIETCKQHISRGDVFEIVPSRRFSRSYEGDDFNVYRALRSINPSPYLFYLDGGDFRLFGSSPEVQLMVKEGVAEIHPIAGTYRRSGNDTEDTLSVQQLVADPKESAEHVMLVDLARNDLSIHCHPVTVDRFKEVQIYSHVIHLVSKVSGTISAHSSPLEVLTTTFPAGTLSGAPKYKAMELIDRYEGVRRNSYGGMLGYIGFDGSINHAIVIRSFVSKQGKLHCQAGGGVVADSDPNTEVQEVKGKLAALMQAMERAQEIAS